MTAWRRIQKTQKENVDENILIVLRLPKNLEKIYLDAKHFRIKKKPYTLYVALDANTKKPICWILLARYELKEGYDRILSFLRRRNYRIRAVISDKHMGLISSVKDYYPLAIHQRCAFHVLQEVYRKIGGKWFLSTGTGKEIWPIFRKIALRFDNYFEARDYLKKSKRKYPDYRKGFMVLEKSLEDIYKFSYLPNLNIQRTSNQIENFMGILEQRLKTFRSIKTPQTLIKIITSFIRIKYKRPTK